MVLDCWDVSYSNAGLEQRLLGSHWLTLAHRRGHVAGFVAGRHLKDLEADGRTEDAAVIDAAVVHPSFQRFGIASKLIGKGVLETTRARNGTIPLAFKPVPIVMATGSRYALAFGKRFLKGVAGPGYRPDPRYQALIRAVAERLEWDLDEWNIQKNGRQCLEDDARLPDLHPHEVLAVAGDLTATKWLKLQWLLRFQYPARYWNASRRRRGAGMPVPSAAGAHLMLGVPAGEARTAPAVSPAAGVARGTTLSEFVALSEISKQIATGPAGRAKPPSGRPGLMIEADGPDEARDDPFRSPGKRHAADPFAA